MEPRGSARRVKKERVEASFGSASSIVNDGDASRSSCFRERFFGGNNLASG